MDVYLDCPFVNRTCCVKKEEKGENSIGMEIDVIKIYKKGPCMAWDSEDKRCRLIPKG